jgi:hypothetical protein
MLVLYFYLCQVVHGPSRPKVQYYGQNTPELSASYAVDYEVDGAVDDGQEPRDHVYHQLPLRTKIYSSRSEAFYHHIIPKNMGIINYQFVMSYSNH